MYFCRGPPSIAAWQSLSLRTHKAHCRQVYPQPITKKLQLQSMLTGKILLLVSPSQIRALFLSSQMAYITWRGYGPTFSQVDCPQFDYFPQLAASWIVQCVPHRSGSSVRREKSMSQSEKKRLIFCFCLIFSSTHLQFPFFFFAHLLDFALVF